MLLMANSSALLHEPGLTKLSQQRSEHFGIRQVALQLLAKFIERKSHALGLLAMGGVNCFRALVAKRFPPVRIDNPFSGLNRTPFGYELRDGTGDFGAAKTGFYQQHARPDGACLLQLRSGENAKIIG